MPRWNPRVYVLICVVFSVLWLALAMIPTMSTNDCLTRSIIFLVGAFVIDALRPRS